MHAMTRPTTAVGLAVAVVVMTATTWGWQARIFRARPMQVTGEPWEQVKDEYPLPHEIPPRVLFAPETAEAVVQANPFSPQRRFVPPPPTGGSDGAASPTPDEAQFLYKGQISVGKRQRAIMENTTTRKTHFLEVGQEVAGFKVLDITQNQVVLSNLHTHEDVVVPLVTSAGPGGAKGAPGLKEQAAPEPPE